MPNITATVIIIIVIIICTFPFGREVVTSVVANAVSKTVKRTHKCYRDTKCHKTAVT